MANRSAGRQEAMLGVFSSTPLSLDTPLTIEAKTSQMSRAINCAHDNAHAHLLTPSTGSTHISPTTLIPHFGKLSTVDFDRARLHNIQNKENIFLSSLFLNSLLNILLKYALDLSHSHGSSPVHISVDVAMKGGRAPF